MNGPRLLPAFSGDDAQEHEAAARTKVWLRPESNSASATRSRPEHVHGLEQPGSESWHNRSTGPAVQIGTRCCNGFAKQFLARNFCNVPPTAAGKNGTCEVKNYVKRVDCIFPDHKIFKRDIDRAVFYFSTLVGRGIQGRALSQQRSLAKINEHYRTRDPSGESFAATTDLRRENQSPNLHKSRIATSAP
jgi:hypothetical protein